MLVLLKIVAWLFHCIRNVFIYFLAISWQCGRYILLFLGSVWNVLNDTYSGISILTDYVVRLVGNAVEGFINTSNYLWDTANVGAQEVTETTNKFMQKIQFAGESVKEGAVYFFYLLWFLITLVPLLMVELLMWFSYSLLLAYNASKDWLLEFATTVMADLPRYLICFVVILILIMLRYHIFMLIKATVPNVRQLRYRLAVLLVYYWGRLQRHNQNRQNARMSQISPNFHRVLQSNKLPVEYLCVVCYDRAKNIVLMPCRHLCLCKYCSDYLYCTRVFDCPLCRELVQTRIVVYI